MLLVYVQLAVTGARPVVKHNLFILIRARGTYMNLEAPLDSVGIQQRSQLRLRGH